MVKKRLPPLKPRHLTSAPAYLATGVNACHLTIDTETAGRHCLTYRSASWRTGGLTSTEVRGKRVLRELSGVTIGPSAVDVVVRYWHRVGGESMVARRRGSGARLPLGLVVARQSQALCRTYN